MTKDSEKDIDAEEPPSDEDLFEMFEEKFLIEENDGWSTYSPEGAAAGELLYKWSIAHAIEEGDEDYPDSWSIEAITLTRISNDIHDKVEEWEKYDDSPYWELRFLISDDVVLFHTLANEILQGLAGELLDDQIVSESRKGQSSLRMSKNLPQEVKEDLLYFTGVIDSGLKGEMANVRKTRNRLIHDLRDRHYLVSIDNVESRLERTFNVINGLHEIKYGSELFKHIEMSV